MKRSRLPQRVNFRRRPSGLTWEQLEARQMLAADFGGNECVEGELLVQFTSQASAAEQAQARALIAGQVREVIHTKAMQDAGSGKLERVALGRGLDMAAAIRAIQRNPTVAFAEPNYILKKAADSNDLYYTNGNLWGMYSDDLPAAGPTGTTNQFGSQAEKAWAAGFTGSPNVVVGVIDEGIDINHPDLADNIWVNPGEIAGNGIDDDTNGYIDDVNGWDFFNNDKTVYDGTGDDHATHVAGTIGGKGGNGIGVAGVNWSVKMISAKFLGPRGGSTSDAVLAVDYLTNLKNRGINVVASNNSWGGGGYSSALHSAINRHAKSNILFVAAAGNNTSNNDATASYPSNYSTLQSVTGGESAASYEGVIAVASITSAGGLSNFSNYGATTVDIAAPGSNIMSTLPGNTYNYYSGTSMATPHVTGAVALFASTQTTPASGNTIRQAILNSATPTASLAGKTVTGGRLNVLAAINQAALVVSTPTPDSSTSENGDTVSFTVSLKVQPTADVTVQVVSSNTGEGAVVSPASLPLTFNATNWNSPQTVTIQGQDDSVYDQTVAYNVTLTASSTGDSRYNGLSSVVALTNLDNDPVPPTKFYVVDDGSLNRTFGYAKDDGTATNGISTNSSSLATANSTPRGIAMTAAGDKAWVVDGNRSVYVYNTTVNGPVGTLSSSWTAGGIATNGSVQGIATDGTNIWIVDAKSDRVFYYANAATTNSNPATVTSFTLGTGNTNPTDIVFGSDGTNRYLWVVNSGTTDVVYRYTLGGNNLSSGTPTSWTLHSSNSTPTGITLDPSNGSNDIWVVDSGTDRVYRYADARVSTPTGTPPSFALSTSGGNTNPQGIADPPPAGFSGEVLVPSAIVAEELFVGPLPQDRRVGSGNSATESQRLTALQQFSSEELDWEDAIPGKSSSTQSGGGIFVGPLAQLDNAFSLWS